MPALPPAPFCFRLQLKHTDGADMDVLSRLFFLYSGTPPTSAQLVTLANAAVTAWAASLANVCSTSITLTEVIIQDLNTLTGATGVSTTSHAGVASVGSLVAQQATLVNMHVARRYRGGKPRVYFPYGGGTYVNDPQTWTGGFVSDVNAQLATFVADIVAAPWAGATITGLVNVSYYAGFASAQNPVTLRWKNYSLPRTAPVIDAITSFACNTKFGSQRRRTLHSA